MSRKHNQIQAFCFAFVVLLLQFINVQLTSLIVPQGRLVGIDWYIWHSFLLKFVSSANIFPFINRSTKCVCLKKNLCVCDLEHIVHYPKLRHLAMRKTDFILRNFNSKHFWTIWKNTQRRLQTQNMLHAFLCYVWLVLLCLLSFIVGNHF